MKTLIDFVLRLQDVKHVTIEQKQANKSGVLLQCEERTVNNKPVLINSLSCCFMNAEGKAKKFEWSAIDYFKIVNDSTVKFCDNIRGKVMYLTIEE